MQTEATANASLERHDALLTSLLATFPRVLPTKLLMTRALQQFNEEVNFVDARDKVKVEAETLRGMLGYVRRNVRRNGRGARLVCDVRSFLLSV